MASLTTQECRPSSNGTFTSTRIAHASLVSFSENTDVLLDDKEPGLRVFANEEQTYILPVGLSPPPRYPTRTNSCLPSHDKAASAGVDGKAPVTPVLPDALRKALLSLPLRGGVLSPVGGPDFHTGAEDGLKWIPSAPSTDSESCESNHFKWTLPPRPSLDSIFPPNSHDPVHDIFYDKKAPLVQSQTGFRSPSTPGAVRALASKLGHRIPHIDAFLGKQVFSVSKLSRSQGARLHSSTSRSADVVQNASSRQTFQIPYLGAANRRVDQVGFRAALPVTRHKFRGRSVSSSALPVVAELGRMSDSGVSDHQYSESRGSEYAVSTTSRPSCDLPDSAPQTKRRQATQPLTSHVRHASDSSSISRSSSFMNGPPSGGAALRISISSTIYPSSSYPHSLQSHIQRSPVLRDQLDTMTTTRYPAGFSPTPSHESFMDLQSPSTPQYRTVSSYDDFTSFQLHPQPYPSSMDRSGAVKPDLSLETQGSVLTAPNHVSNPQKPPIPSTPKPSFNRSLHTPQHKQRQALSLSGPSTPNTSPKTHLAPDACIEDLPPTTNFLKAAERNDLVRKSRKLAQVFGQTPSGQVLAPWQNTLRASDTPTSRSDLTKTWYAEDRSHVDTTVYMSASGRRRSVPLSPDDFSFLSTGDVHSVSGAHPIEISSEQGVPTSETSSLVVRDQSRADSPTSFIDLSEEEGQNDDHSILFLSDPTKRHDRHRGLFSPSLPSFLENMTPEQQAEEERRRKRDKLAKLHRFLGSRVPPELALGVDSETISLPPVASPVDTYKGRSSPEDDADFKLHWLRRRRSSSAAATSPVVSYDEAERLKEDLDDKEKAINVKRALKMEKVFGVLPPQAMYHTRHGPSASITATYLFPEPPAVRQGSQSSTAQVSPVQRNRNQSAYTKSKKSNRPGTSESKKQLLNKRSSYEYEDSLHDPSSVYAHYQHSLHSLNEIIDRDDKASLAELHQYLNSEDSTSPELSRGRDRSTSITASIKSERRRSLPTRTSLMSINSEYSLAAVTPPEISDFELRRRRAAKLTHFFGVDYRELIRDVLESIEKGVEEERKRGTLNADEAQDLLRKLRRLRTKREPLVGNKVA